VHEKFLKALGLLHTQEPNAAEQLHDSRSIQRKERQKFTAPAANAAGFLQKAFPMESWS
jgi:hypothetical protein